MKYFLDTEFLEDGRTIELISIGVVCEDGREYYAVNYEAPWQRIANNDWLRENVLPHLPLSTKYVGPHHLACDIEKTELWRTKAEIKADLIEFVQGDDIEMWAYYGDYDWVVTCRLFGRMIDLPKSWPKFCYDLRQWLNHKNLKHVRQPDEDPHHHALADARWGADTYKFYSKIAGL